MPTAIAGSGSDVHHGDHDRGRLRRPEVDAAPHLLPAHDELPDGDDGALHGRVDVRTRRRADVEHVRAGRPALELVPARRVAARAARSGARGGRGSPRSPAGRRAGARASRRSSRGSRSRSARRPRRAAGSGGSRSSRASAAAGGRRSRSRGRSRLDEDSAPPCPTAGAERGEDSVTMPSTPSTERSTSRRARRWARRLRSRRRAACRERGEAIGSTVAHVEPDFIPEWDRATIAT